MATALRLSVYAAITILNLHFCRSLAEFEQFPGFDVSFDTNITSRVTTKPTTEFFFYTPSENAPNISGNVGDMNNIKLDVTETSNITQETWNTSTPVSCPEEERPTNIGPYEVPTQRDLVIHMKAKLLKMFKKYHKKALYFLKDIKEATRATSEIAYKCPTRQRQTYKKCVQHVKNQCKMITKNLVTSLEYQRYDVTALTEGSICNMTAMKTDPVELIKNLAMEEASLEFALPGFLRLLSACSYYCNTSQNNAKHRLKPTRHMSDQELVVKHFLTRKNYLQLIKATP